MRANIWRFLRLCRSHAVVKRKERTIKFHSDDAIESLNKGAAIFRIQLIYEFRECFEGMPEKNVARLKG